ncbi:hydantoinase B/oxoprolinase family protein [Falsiroseomonas sp.]|uniref:hydantoinase B/oxoprolinase family protein n=1 Tax=Falsiroseomonas sp. TaxID=2870721 RepID=UPI002736C770|nr:hydantoinase B/oxoprolinase family protein [Falsiroseomonas sp.]MDP3417297.1 hydantoinase B/oxoprolinase family protein [Falsiroseomonas sp.]
MPDMIATGKDGRGRDGADPIAMEVFANRLLSITEEMGNVLVRASFSTNIKERKDCSVGMFDARGRCLAQAAHMPMHLGSLMGAVVTVLERYRLDQLRPGDAFVCNDVFLAGGTHQPDINIITPIFVEDRVAFFAANTGHHSDVGGPNPGSMSQSARSIFEEGLRIPVMRIVRAGELDLDLLEMIAHNSREPVERILDLRAQIAVNERGVELMGRLVATDGLAATEAAIEALLAYTGRRLRARIATLPDGEYAGERWMDGDGVPGGGPIVLRAKAVVKGDDLLLDFAGSAAQARGALNIATNALQATCYYAVKALLDPELPANSGLFDAIRISAPEGSICNPRFPAATCARAISANRLSGAIFDAFSKVLPAASRMAHSHDSVPAFVVAGERRTGPYVYLETIGGGAGARLGADGADAVQMHVTNSSNLPAEAMEIEYPVLVDEYALVPDSGGAGRWRGGLGIARQVSARVDGTLITARGEGHEKVAPGLDGGLQGGRALLLIEPGTERERLLPTATTALPVAAGVGVRMETPGGGGLGDPGLRDPGTIAADILDGKVTRAAAERDYGAARVAEALATWRDPT